MANARTGNTYYVDTAYTATVATLPELAIPNLKVYYVVVTATAANAVVLLTDSGTNKVDLRVAPSGSSQLFTFDEYPMVFNTSLRVSTLTNAVATIMFEEVRR